MGHTPKNRFAKSGDNRERVAVAMSGGVDSSVAAALLVQEGFAVVGLTMKLFDRTTTGSPVESVRGCCSIDALNRAAAVCRSLDVPHYSVDLIDEFNQYVIQDFINDYVEGRTPNPCVRCNTYLKWGCLFEKAKLLECDYLATGHYARILQSGEEFQLLRASNPDKDQAYALWGIPLDKLSKTLFPLGSLKKTEVRKIASELGLKTAETQESQEICFVPDGHYSELLERQRPEFFESLKPGELLEEGADDLNEVGNHRGYPFYTVGQRKGLGGGFTEPRYVLRVDAQTNQVIIGGKEKLLERRFLVDQVNWLITEPADTIHADVQVRYRSGAFPASISSINADDAGLGDRLLVEFEQPVEAIAPGQSAVFFQGERLIGGSRICEVLRRSSRGKAEAVEL